MGYLRAHPKITALPLRVTPKALKLFILPLLVSAGFFFSHFSFATIEEKLVKSSNDIERVIIPRLAEAEKTEYTDLLKNMRSADRIGAKRAVQLLMFKLATREKIDKEDREANARVMYGLVFLLEDIRNEPITNLKETATKYFTEYLKDNLVQIDFDEKISGVHLGQKAIITLKDSGNQINYYIKTHRGGLVSSTQTPGGPGSKPVDPKELLVYKVFELIGLAPEVHFFFGESAHDFYIATKDAGFDELTHKQKTFVPYENLNKIEKIQPSYAKITSIYEAWDKVLVKTVAASDRLEMDLDVVALNIINGLSKANILSRIFLLEDFITNGGNLGFILEDSLAKFSIIDFTTPRTEGAYRTDGSFNGFLAGNGYYLYSAAVDRPIRYAVCLRQPAKRVQTARETMRELTMVVASKKRQLNNETIDMASRYVQQIISRCPKFFDQSNAMKDLDAYVDSIKIKLREFKEGFLLYTDDHIHRILEHFLPQCEGFIVIPPAAAIFESEVLMEHATRNAFQTACAGNVVAVPIYIHGNHWVGAIFRRQADGTIQIIYNNPQGDELKSEPFTTKFVKIIKHLAEEMTPGKAPNIVDLYIRQQRNSFDCGPFTVDNLIRIARHATELEGLDRNGIIERAELQQPVDGNAVAIRHLHNTIFPLLGLQIPTVLGDENVCSHIEAPQLNDTVSQSPQAEANDELTPKLSRPDYSSNLAQGEPVNLRAMFVVKYN